MILSGIDIAALEVGPAVLVAGGAVAMAVSRRSAVRHDLNLVHGQRA